MRLNKEPLQTFHLQCGAPLLTSSIIAHQITLATLLILTYAISLAEVYTYFLHFELVDANGNVLKLYRPEVGGQCYVQACGLKSVALLHAVWLDMKHEKILFISLGKHSNCFLALKNVYTVVSFDPQALLTKFARAGAGTVRDPPPPEFDPVVH